jgi:prevent-host-death family protein
MKKAIPYLIGVGDLQRRASAVIREVAEKHGEGFVVSHNEPQAVLVSLKRYETLKALEEAKRVEEEDILGIIQAGDEEFDSGKTKKARSLKEFLP